MASKGHCWETDGSLLLVDGGLESTETNQLYVLLLGRGFDDGVQRGVQRVARRSFREFGFFDNCVNQFRFVQLGLLSGQSFDLV